MRLTTLKVSGLKTLAAQRYELPPCAAFLGRNATGKTAVRQAVELLVLGYAIDLVGASSKPGGDWQRRGGATMALAAGDRLRVSGLMGDTSFARTWQVVDGSVTTELMLGGSRSKKAAEGHVENLLGPSDALELVLSIDGFLRLSGEKRREYLAHRSGQGAMRAQAAAQTIREHVTTAYPAADAEVLRALIGKPRDPADAWLCQVIASARSIAHEEGRERAKALDRLIAERQAQLDAAEQTPEAVLERLTLLRHEREIARALLEAGPDSRIQALQRRETELANARGGLQDVSMAAPTFDATEIAALEETEERMREGITEANRELQEAEEDLDRGKRRYEQARITADRLRSALVLHQKVHDGHGGAPRCPTCQQRLDEDAADLLDASLLEADEEVDSAANALPELQERRRAIADGIKHAHNLLEQAARQAARARESSNRARQQEALAAEVARLDGELAEVRAELAALRAKRSGKDHHAKVVQLSTEIGELEEVRGRAERIARELRGYRHDRAACDNALAVCRLVVEAAGPKGLQGQLAAALTEPILRVAAPIVERCGLPRLEIRLEDDKGKPTWEPTMGGIPSSTWCGAEAAIGRAALSAGVARVTGCLWPVVVVDAVEGIDLERRQAFMSALASMVEAGDISQALLFGCPDDRRVPDGWAVLEV